MGFGDSNANGRGEEGAGRGEWMDEFEMDDFGMRTGL
jgi:hypothetical protein